MIKKNIVFFATRDWILSRFFASQLNHFIVKKYNVYAVCKITDKKNLSNFKNLITININVHKTNINFITLITEIYTANKVISSLKPNLLINCGMKAIFITFIYSFLCPRIKIINFIVGLGNFFNKKFSLLKLIVINFLKILFAKKNYSFVVESINLKNRISVLFSINKSRIFVVGGVGIDTSKFKYSFTKFNKNQKIKFLIISRLLVDKGINELYFCINKLLPIYKNKIHFTIIGDLDEDNPNNISNDVLLFFKNNTMIHHIPSTNKINKYIKDSHILIHPSYHEGLSVVCQEAVCCGRGIITTNIPGCREIVRHKVNGLLVESRNKEDLLKKILYLINNSYLINNFSKKSFYLINKFSKETINQKINIYFKKLL